MSYNWGGFLKEAIFEEFYIRTLKWSKSYLPLLGLFSPSMTMFHEIFPFNNTHPPPNAEINGRDWTFVPKLRLEQILS